MNSAFKYEFIAIIGMGMVTFFIRILPFLGIVPRFALQRLEERQEIFPTMFLTLLVIYCYSPIRSLPTREGVIQLGCGFLVALLQWMRGNVVVSLGIGTAIYLILINCSRF